MGGLCCGLCDKYQSGYSVGTSNGKDSGITNETKGTYISQTADPTHFPSADADKILSNDPKKRDNWRFYNNEIKFRPNGDYIDTIHHQWWADYEKLEQNHSYIQWLFPKEERGMNPQAQTLQQHEAEAIRKNALAKSRVLKSYRMMLDFYGMRMEDDRTGVIQRAYNWQERFDHLNHPRAYHNYLRITRILKSIGYLGCEHLKAPLVEFFLREAMVEKTLTGCVPSCQQFWLETIRSDVERKRLYDFIDQHSQPQQLKQHSRPKKIIVIEDGNGK